MIVLVVLMALFELSKIFPKLMLSNQATRQKQFNGVVQGSPRNTVVLVLHVYVQRFNVEVTFEVIYFSQNGKTFGCLAVAILFEIG